MRQFILIPLSFLFLPLNGYSCSCVVFPDFFDNIYLRDYSQHCIARLDSFSLSESLMGNEGLSAETGHFTVIDTLGEIKTTIGQNIIVYGQDGANCGAPINPLTIGDTFLLGLSPRLYEPFVKDTFYLDGCGRFYLNLNKEYDNEWNKADLKQAIRDITTNTREILLQKKVKLFPNPSQQSFQIETDNLKIQQIRIFNVQGQNLQSLAGIKTSHPIIVSELEVGIYFLEIQTDQGKLLRKLIKY